MSRRHPRRGGWVRPRESVQPRFRARRRRRSCEEVGAMRQHLSSQRRTFALAIGAVSLAVIAIACTAAPDVAEAALRSAAGGSGGGAGGFDRFVRFIDRLADYTIPVGAAFSVLGLIWGGMLFQAGDSRAGRVLGLVVLGVGVVLMSKPIAA